MSNHAGLAVGGKEAHSNGRIPLDASDTAAPETIVSWDREANIFTRLLRAIREIPQLEKDGNAPKDNAPREKGQGLPYAFITHDLVTLHAKKVLLKNGIYFMPEVTDIRQEGNRTEVRINGHFINADKPEERVTYPGIGYGIDGSDKGPGKGYSYACKYVLAKALMMSTADDIETSNQKFEPDGAAAIKQEAKQDKAAALRAWGNSFKAALTTAKSPTEIDKLQKDNRETLMSEDTPDVTREFFIELIQQRKALLGGENAA